MGEAQSKLMVRPQEFFRERVVTASANQNLTLGNDVEFYLVNLLCEFIKPEKLATFEGELSALDTPLALMLAQAVEAPPTMQVRIYKYLGDTSLYFAGFFQDYFNRKTYDVGYYISLGASAYDCVSSLMRDQHGDDHFSEMFSDLAGRFNALVDVVAEVSETPNTDKPVDVLAIYDRWNRSNSERLRKMLTKLGILPLHSPTRERQ